MKQALKSAVPFLALAILTACGNESGKEMDHKNHGSDPVKNDEQAKAKPSVQLKDENLNAIYQHYVHLTTSLVNGDSAEAKIAANAIEAGAKETAGAEAVASSSSKIVSASGLEAQREEYARLSTEMIGLVKKSGVSEGEVYVDYCPMAMNDKGAYWLSSRKEIVNPYFGDKMLKCGEVKETLN